MQPSDLLSPLLEAPENWGEYRIVDADPSITKANGLVYRPWSTSEPWGLFEDTEMSDIQVLNDEFMYCGVFNCHFGHLFVDTVARLWPSRSERTGKLLFHSSEPPTSWFARTYVRDVMSALSININNVVVLDRPVRVPHLRVVETSMRERCYIHRIFGKLCRSLGNEIGIPNRPAATGKIAYFSRSQLSVGTAKFVNESALDKALIDLGVDIIYSETMHLQEQLARMHDARCVIGVTGSALHLSALCGNKRIVGISAGRLVNSNFRMIDAVCENRASYVYPREMTTVETPPGFHAAWRLEDVRGVAEALVSLAETPLASSGSYPEDLLDNKLTDL